MDSIVPDIYPQSIISWKGKTFQQITSIYKKNDNDTQNNYNPRLFFNPGPIKLYRKEIAALDISNCYSRVSSSIDEINRPNGSVITNYENPNGLVNTLDFNVSNNLYTPVCLNQDPVGCSSSNTNVNNCLSQQTNARRRVRSAGMIRKVFANDGTNQVNYCTNTNQYLQSRAKTYEKNQYNYVRQGSAVAKPGDSLSSANIYSSNSIHQCPKYFLQTDSTFKYQWFDAVKYTVVVPRGNYSIEDINNLLRLTMITNKHYFINNATHTSVFLINIVYNESINKVEIQCSAANTNIIFQNTEYSVPTETTTPFAPVAWSQVFANNYTVTYVPVVIFNENNAVGKALGFAPGYYPHAEFFANYYYIAEMLPSDTFALNGSNFPVDQSIMTTNQVSFSTLPILLLPGYKQVYYKPSNPQFATQGGVSASARIQRVKYDTITTSASQASHLFSFGNATMDALAYGVSEQPYTTKDKIGYPIKMTPVISKYTGKVCPTISKFTNMS